jgi:hypothetical protein
MMVPNTGDVTDQDMEDLTELIIFSAPVFESRGGFRSDDIFVTFQRPVDQQIIFVSCPDGLPAPLSRWALWVRQQAHLQIDPGMSCPL